MRHRTLLGLVVVVWVAANGLAPGGEPFRLEDRVVEHTLPNGMKFLFMRRTGAPVFSANITFRVGGVDERPGITGLAHLYEHMAFKGTHTLGVTNYRKEKPLLAEIDAVAVPLSDEMAKGDLADKTKIEELRKKLKALEEKARRFVVKDELWDTYLRNGASGLNASTGKDVTNYYVSLPSNRVELWAWLESDRLLNPVLREFYSERDVVCEEHRLGIETQPMGRLFQDFNATAMLAHPARYEVIGWMSDIQTMTRPQAEEFRRSHYVPANAAVALVGDIDIARCRETAARYFGRMPARPLPPPIRTQEPEQRGERRVVVEWDAQPQLLIAFHKPSPRHADEAVFDMIDGVLSSGRTSRFYKTLVRDRRLATSVNAFTQPTERYPNLFCISATPLYPHTTREVEQAIYEVMQTLISDLPSDEELQKVRNNLHAAFLRQLQSNRGLARSLAYYQAVFGDWREMEKHLERIDRVTPQDVRRVAEKYFIPINRTVGEIVRTTKSQEKGN
jgi:predicted Zn-dependent peptidase